MDFALFLRRSEWNIGSNFEKGNAVIRKKYPKTINSISDTKKYTSNKLGEKNSQELKFFYSLEKSQYQTNSELKESFNTL